MLVFTQDDVGGEVGEPSEWKRTTAVRVLA